MESGEYFITPNGDPYFNMALDEWLFKRLRKKLSPCKAILRLYTWEREAITIGYNQSISKAVDWSKIPKELPIIRRITGGRAIHHDATELTFSLALDLGDLPHRLQALSETNRLISESVVKSFDILGIEAGWARTSDLSFKRDPGRQKKSCFGSLSQYEVISGQAKVAAGAQRRVESCLIHQGSIKINGISYCPAVGQGSNCGDCDNVTGDNRQHSVTIDDFSAVFGEVLSVNLGVDFRTSTFSPGELEEIERYRVNLTESCLNKRGFN